MFQCTPVNYFWDKTIKGGTCLPNALITIGMSNGVLSFVGDLFILAMPIPMILKLNLNARRKAALIAMFLLGAFVCLTSIFRFVALLSINVKDLTFTQVAPGLWTYVELGIGITSGNLPLLRPIFGNFFAATSVFGSSRTKTKSKNSLGYGAQSRSTGGTNHISANGWNRMDDGRPVDIESMPDDGSEIELQKGRGITVKTEVDLEIEQVRGGIEQELQKQQRNQLGTHNFRTPR